MSVDAKGGSCTCVTFFSMDAWQRQPDPRCIWHGAQPSATDCSARFCCCSSVGYLGDSENRCPEVADDERGTGRCWLSKGHHVAHQIVWSRLKVTIVFEQGTGTPESS